MQHRKLAAGLGGLALVGGLGVTATTLNGADASTPATTTHTAVVAAAHHGRWAGAKTVSGHFVALNNSGVRGHVTLKVKGHRVKVHIMARGLMKGVPHAAHIHWSPNTSHTCPTNAQDTNGDHRLTVTEGAAVYGAIQASLTTKGDTSPASALAVDRFPTTPKGVENYTRVIHVSGKLARLIKHGNVHVVIHGLDYNNNGVYDFGTTGASDIAPSLPAEATDPAACAVIN